MVDAKRSVRTVDCLHTSNSKKRVGVQVAKEVKVSDSRMKDEFIPYCT